MHYSYSANEILFMGVTFLVGGMYGIWMGILGITNSNMKIPGLHQFGMLITSIVYGKAKTAQAEKDLDDPKEKRKMGLVLLPCGIVLLGLSLFLLFGSL